MKLNKKAQEEMIGFAVIIVLVMVILLIFLRFALVDKEDSSTSGTQAQSFMQVYLKYTTTCQTNKGLLDIEDLISSCIDREECFDGGNSCEVLEETTKGILSQTWDIEKTIRGYELIISSEDNEIINIEYGNATRNYQNYSNIIPKQTEVRINFNVYS